MVKDIVVVDFRKKVKTEMISLDKDKSVCEQNKRLIREFARDCYAEGLSHGRVLKYINITKLISRKLGKPFPKVDVNNIKQLLEAVELSDFSPWTKRDYRIAVKKFWRWLSGDNKDPPIIAWIKTTLSGAKKKHPSEMLTEDEVKRLIQAADNPRDRAMIAVFWETGCRVGELLTLRVKSFKESSEICYLDVFGKTGPRRIPIVACVPHLTKWLLFHPMAADPDSPMWLVMGAAGERPNLQYRGFSLMLSRLTRKVGIRKRVHPHLFRHSRATFLANRLTEAQMKQFFGWTQGSEMASTYVHLSGRDIQDSILQIYGKGLQERKTGPKVTVVSCPRCGFENASDSRFCGRCGSTVSVGETVSLSDKLQIYDDLLNVLLSDETVVSALKQKLGSDSKLAERLKQFLKA